MNRPIVPHNSNRDVDETTDTRDTIDWLLKNVPGNNGRVGVFGLSYDGFLAMMAGIDAHPAVKAISPQAPITNVWMGDDFFHNGAFRESYGFDYVQEMEAQKTDARVDMMQDMQDFFLHHVNFAGAVATVPEVERSAHGEGLSNSACVHRVLAGDGRGRSTRRGESPRSRSAAIGTRRTCGAPRPSTPH